MANQNTSEELERLASLRDRGVLSEQEFQDQKAALLSGNQNAVSAAPKKSKVRGAGIGCLVLVAIIIGIAVLAGSGNKQPSGSSGATPSAPPIEVTANQLFQAYQANEARAQRDYGDKPLLVSGTVDGVDLNIADNPVVKLSTSNEFMSAQASLDDASKPKAADLSKGQKVKLLCSGVTEVLSTPMLADCALQS